MPSAVGAYARAFADVVVSDKLDAATIVGELHALEALLDGNARLRRILENPSIPGAGKRGLLDGIAMRQGMTRQARNFIAVIIDHLRLPLFGKIVKQVEVELNHRLGLTDADVTSARELAVGEKEVLEGQISAMTGKKVRARYEEDPSLLGGVVVKVGSTVYDGSVKGQLSRIRERLVEA